MRGYKVFLLVIIGFFVYGNTLFNGFVLDDEPQILQNSAVHSIVNLPSVFTGSTFNNGGVSVGLYYKPLMQVVFALIYSLFGATASIFHLVQIGLHIGVSILVYLLFKRLLKRDLLSWFLALIFLVHPINAESVVYISDYQDVLFVFFGLLSLLVESPIVSALLLLSSLLSKETGIMMLLITTFYYFLYRRKDIKTFLISATGILLIYIILRFGIAHVYFTKSTLTPMAVLPLSERLLSIPAIIFYYLKTFVWPLKLVINQLWIVKNISLSNFVIPLIISAIFFTLIFWRSKEKANIFFVFWFMAGLAAHLHIFPLDVTVSDRWFYLPMIGLLGIIGSIKIPHISRSIIAAAAFSLILLLSVRTIVRTFDWRNGLTLTRHDIVNSPNNFLMENAYGVELFRIKNYDEATIHFQRSVELQPRWWENYNNLAVSYLLKGDLLQAEKYYKTSISNGMFYDASANLGLLYLKEEKYEAAVIQLEKTLKIFPQSLQNPKILYGLAVAYYQTGQKEKALRMTTILISIAPTEQYQNLYNLIKDSR